MNTPAPLDATSAEERVLGWQTKLHRWTVQDEHKRLGDVFNLLCDPATLLGMPACLTINTGGL